METGGKNAPAPASPNSGRVRCFILIMAIIFSVALIVLVIWFTIQPIKPHCSLEEFFIPRLNKASNDSQAVNSTAISLELSFFNRNSEKSIYYDNLDMTLYYYGKSLTSPIGNTSIPKFYQQHRHTKHHAETIQTFGVPWEDVKMKASNGSTAIFRVDLVMNVRYRNGIWKTRRHELRLGVNVTINDQGMKSVNHSLRLLVSRTTQKE
ncbi:protein NDR1-like [Papaver somniferum]|uniref:protein NDR1-like n=1 Tax=Papaver somniferum TaxID=3469 RepID=UPI000E6FFCA2|nr:protein NDR1-like [Papaver somniferum]